MRHTTPAFLSLVYSFHSIPRPLGVRYHSMEEGPLHVDQRLGSAQVYALGVGFWLQL